MPYYCTGANNAEKLEAGINMALMSSITKCVVIQQILGPCVCNILQFSHHAFLVNYR